MARGLPLAGAGPEGVSERCVEDVAFTSDGRGLVTGGWPELWTVAEEALRGRKPTGDGDPPLRPLLCDAGEFPALVATGGECRWADMSAGSSLRVEEHEWLTVVLAAGGRPLVGGDESGVVRAWNLSFSDSIAHGRTYEGYPEQPVWSYREEEPADQRLLCLCDGGRLVVSPRRGRLVVLDAGTGAVVTTIAVPAARPAALAGHPGAPVVVLADGDGHVLWWDARTGAELGHLRAHDGRVRALAVAADAGLLLSASRDGTAALWRLADGASLARFTPAEQACPAVAAGWVDPYELAVAAGSPDGRRWLVGGCGGQVHILGWSADGGLVPLRTGHPAATSVLDVDALVGALRNHATDGAACEAAARTLTAPDTHAALGWPNHPHEAHERTTEALAEAATGAEDLPTAEAAVIALAGIAPHAAASAWRSMSPRWSGTVDSMAERMLARLTGEQEPTVAWLLEQLPHIDGFPVTLVIEALAERGPAAAQALQAVLRSFPPGWDDIDGRRLMSTICALEPAVEDQRRALALMLASTTPYARYIAMDAYTSAKRNSRHGYLDPMFDLVDDAVHDCAVRELSPTGDPGAAGGYGSADNQYEAVYALRFCYRDSDAPLVARVFATMDDPSIIDIGLNVVQSALETDPHLDDGLLDALHRFATDPGLDNSIRRSAILCAYASASETVVSWLVTALDDTDHGIAASAALSLLYHDKERFTPLVEPLLDEWTRTGRRVWEIDVARKELADDS